MKIALGADSAGSPSRRHRRPSQGQARPGVTDLSQSGYYAGTAEGVAAAVAAASTSAAFVLRHRHRRQHLSANKVPGIRRR